MDTKRANARPRASETRMSSRPEEARRRLDDAIRETEKIRALMEVQAQISRIGSSGRAIAPFEGPFLASARATAERHKEEAHQASHTLLGSYSVGSSVLPDADAARADAARLGSGVLLPRVQTSENNRAELDEMKADIRLLKNTVNALLEQRAEKDAVGAVEEGPEMQPVRTRPRRSLSLEELATRKAASERMNALMHEWGDDAIITEEEVAEYLAEQEALGLHHPLAPTQQ